MSGSGGRASATTMPKDGQQSGEYVCPVCKYESEDKHCFHYGGVSCYSCRAFFRRAHQNTKDPGFKCKKEGKCEVTVKTRRKCQKCRYDLCLKVGMDPNLVLSEDQKKVRFRNYLKKKAGSGDQANPNDGEGDGLSPPHQQDDQESAGASPPLMEETGVTPETTDYQAYIQEHRSPLRQQQDQQKQQQQGPTPLSSRKRPIDNTTAAENQGDSSHQPEGARFNSVAHIFGQSHSESSFLPMMAILQKNSSAGGDGPLEAPHQQIRSSNQVDQVDYDSMHSDNNSSSSPKLSVQIPTAALVGHNVTSPMPKSNLHLPQTQTLSQSSYLIPKGAGGGRDYTSASVMREESSSPQPPQPPPPEIPAAAAAVAPVSSEREEGELERPADMRKSSNIMDLTTKRRRMSLEGEEASSSSAAVAGWAPSYSSPPRPLVFNDGRSPPRGLYQTPVPFGMPPLISKLSSDNRIMRADIESEYQSAQRQDLAVKREYPVEERQLRLRREGDLFPTSSYSNMLDLSYMSPEVQHSVEELCPPQRFGAAGKDEAIERIQQSYLLSMAHVDITPRFVENLYLFHTSERSNLSKEDFGEHIFRIANHFKEFAIMEPTYQQLSRVDQMRLLSRNTALYVHYIIARYMNAGSGEEQLRWILDVNVPRITPAGELRKVGFLEFNDRLGLLKV